MGRQSAAIAEFAAKSVKQLRYIETSQGCFAVAVDLSDNVYAACGGNDRRGKIEVYAPHGRSPFRTITRGIDKPDALMFDRSGNLFVANCSPCDSYGKKQGGSITVYAPGGNVPVRTITDGIDWPAAMAFDGDDGLVVANRPWVGSGSVTVYGSGSHPTLTITKGVASPDAIAVDSVGNIYASNWAIHERKRYSITVYSVAGNLLRTITDGVSLPSALAIGSN